jgi:hypothetical protein
LVYHLKILLLRKIFFTLIRTVFESVKLTLLWTVLFNRKFEEMKKIVHQFLCIAMLMLCTAVVANAQSVCPPPNNPPIVRNYGVNGVCAVYVDHMWPNRPILLFDQNLNLINLITNPYSTSDANGYGCVIFPCDKIPYKISTCTNEGCCSNFVPAAIVLPIKLSGFNATIEADNTVLLKWSSAVELNSDKYVVQKSYDGGRTFADLGEVKAAKTSYKTLNYSFVDTKAEKGVRYYRLKQVDLDTKFEYSKVVYVNNGNSNANTKISVGPNPFINEVNLIGVVNTEVTEKNIQITSAAGTPVSFKVTGSNTIKLNDYTPTGLYILKFKGQVFKLVKN